MTWMSCGRTDQARGSLKWTVRAGLRSRAWRAKRPAGAPLLPRPARFFQAPCTRSERPADVQKWSFVRDGRSSEKEC
jgi:hypothetical protein